MAASKRQCMYCGKLTKKGSRGEHILPEAIGGALTLNDETDYAVCSTCNNGPLSEVDNELCRRSFLAQVACQHMSSSLFLTWDIDPSANNLLIEAHQVWKDGALHEMKCWPQITFDGEKPTIRGDRDEAEQFGRENFARVLLEAVRNCYKRYSARKKALHFDRVKSGLVRQGFRLPPRVYTPHTIKEIEEEIDKRSFILRFCEPTDRDFALAQLAKLPTFDEFKNFTSILGSPSPTTALYFDCGKAIRGLIKVALNALAYYCPNTPVNPVTFREAIAIILGQRQASREVLRVNGFVRAKDVPSYGATGRNHSIRLVYFDVGAWRAYLSFFGGDIGAAVQLPGPNHESWRTADIIAPIGSKDWTNTTSGILQCPSVRVEWEDQLAVMPSLKLNYSKSTMVTEVYPSKRP